MPHHAIRVVINYDPFNSIFNFVKPGSQSLLIMDSLFDRVRKWSLKDGEACPSE